MDQSDDLGDGLGDGLPVRERPRRLPRLLLAIAVGETLTLAVLLLNLATVSDRGTAAAVGPIHGGLYLTGVLLTWAAPVARRVKVAAVVPVVGAWVGALAARRRATATPPAPTSEVL